MELNEDLLTNEFIERVKKQDSRFIDVDLRLLIEKELRDSLCLRIILDAVAEQSAESLEALAEVDPCDTKRIILLQSKVYRCRFIAQTINSLIRRGEQAEISIRDEQNVINQEV